MIEYAGRDRVEAGGMWLSAHVYHNQPASEFLHGAVRPLIENLERTGGLERYFFVRYGEGGPHVRLRLLGRPDWIDSHARRTLHESLTAYFNRVPGDARLGNGATARISTGRVGYEPYVAEIDRYGGPDRIHIAERQFEISSRMSLELIASVPRWSVDVALACATRLHITLVRAFGMGLREAIGFFEDFAAAWSSALLRSPEWTPERLYTRFAAQYEKQRDVLLALLRPTWLALESNASVADPMWLEPWLRAHQTIAVALKQPDRHGTPLTSVEKHRIAASFVHMTNNRLGIDNRDEALLAFLIQQTLRECCADMHSQPHAPRRAG